MSIPKRFESKIRAHLLGNMLSIDDYPLILAIIGRPGVGKTYQLRQCLRNLGFDVFSINAADLESERAGAPAKLLKEQYVKASVNISKKQPSVIVIDDIDTTVGEWEQNTGTVNHQGILAFLMHIADNPVYMENVGSVNRVPVFLTGNNFNLLYEPLRRTGRTIKFDWEPTREEKINIVSSIFSFTDDKLAELLVDMYPEKEISFFSSIYAEKCIGFLSDISSNATFKTLLKDSNYVKQLYDLYMAKKKSISWQEVFSNLEAGGTNNEHDKN